MNFPPNPYVEKKAREFSKVRTLDEAVMLAESLGNRNLRECEQALCLESDLAEARPQSGIDLFRFGNKGFAFEEYKISKNLHSDFAERFFHLIYQELESDIQERIEGTKRWGIESS